MREAEGTVEEPRLLSDLTEEQHGEPDENQQQQNVRDASVESKTVTSINSLRTQAEHVLSRDGSPSKSIKPSDIISSEQIEDTKAVMNFANGTAALSNNVGMTEIGSNEQLIQGESVTDEMVLDSEASMRGQVVEKIRELHVKLSQCASQVPYILVEPEDVFDLGGTSLQISMPTTETVKDQKIDDISMHIETTVTEEMEARQVDTADECNANEISVVHRKCPGSFSCAVSEHRPALLGKIKVSTFVRGLSNPGKMTFNFTIKQGIHSALSRWIKGLSHR